MREVGWKTAVFVCELRSELGFAAPLLHVADELVRLATREGDRIRTVFVVNDAVYDGLEVAARGHIVLPAPRNRRSIDIASHGSSYANLLAEIGFAHEGELGKLVEAWDRMFAFLSANVVIADHSPLACMAARGRISTFIVGSGFSAPPPDMAYFPAVAGDGQPEANQSLLLEVVNKVLHARGVSRISTLPDLLAGERRAVFALPQLDPYHEHRTERLFAPCIGIAGPLAARQAPSIFFTLQSTFPNLTGVARALQQVSATKFCHVPGPATVGSTLLKEMSTHVFEARPDLDKVLSEVAVVLTASADLALAAYAAGRPQVILRSDLEARVMARNLEKRHAGIAVEVNEVDAIADAISRILNDSSYVQGCREDARRLRTTLALENSVAVAARECLEMIRSSPESLQSGVPADLTHQADQEQKWEA